MELRDTIKQMKNNDGLTPEQVELLKMWVEKL